ncbi:MAG: nucleotidyltransferase family protein [Rhizobacter sp.]|nr:nucleotidyltransferase family protein [Rhizobacter sp.]
MKAIILAAGRGERMRPLTDHCPKPLLEVHGKPLIEWHLEALARGGIDEVVVNTAWLEEQIVARLGDGARFGLHIRYSMEGRDHGGALETAGGLKKALPLLRAGSTGKAVDEFWYVAGDVHAPGFPFGAVPAHSLAGSGLLARLWMVDNPPQHPAGDFAIDAGLATPGTASARLTWSGIGLFSVAFVDELMADLAPGSKAPLRPCLDRAIAQRRLGAVHYNGPWVDVGTPDRLKALQGAADRRGA